MIYTPSTGQADTRSPYADRNYGEQAYTSTPAGSYNPSDHLPEVHGDVQQYNSEFGPGLGRKSPSELAWAMTWVNTRVFVYITLALAALCLLFGNLEGLVGAGYAVLFIFIRAGLRYMRYSAQNRQTYALG